MNQSVPPALLESLRRQNMVESGNKFRNLRVDALGRLADSPIWDRLSKARVDLLGVKGRTLLLEQFQESNAWLGSLAGRDLFYPDLETDVMEASGGMTDVQAHARFGDALQTAMIAELFDRS